LHLWACLPFFAAQLEPLKPKKRYLAFAGPVPSPAKTPCVHGRRAPDLVHPQIRGFSPSPLRPRQLPGRALVGMFKTAAGYCSPGRSQSDAELVFERSWRLASYLSRSEPFGAPLRPPASSSSMRMAAV